MNVYQRPLFRQMGGPVAPGMAAQEAQMAMPPAQDPQMMLQQAQAQAAQEAMPVGEMFAQETMANLDAAESPEQIINALRGNERPMEERYAELAGLVGDQDARSTPESVLALVQPTIMMTEQGAMDSGIGELLRTMTGDVPMETPDGQPTAMGQGVGSLMMAGAPQPEMGVGQQPVANFRQGGVVQRFQEGGEASRLQSLYSEMLPAYQSIMGDGGEQRRMGQAQVLFDIADRAAAFAAGIDPRTGQSVARLSPAAQLGAAVSGLGGQIGQRVGDMEAQDRALRMAALQAAQGEYSAERAAARAAAAAGSSRGIGDAYEAVDAEGNVIATNFLATRSDLEAFQAANPGATIRQAREPAETVTYVDPNNPANVARAVPGSPEAIDAGRNGLLPVSDASTVAGMMPQPTEPATLTERLRTSITDQTVLDNLENLPPQELSVLAAQVVEYARETVSPAGVSSRYSIPINTQEAMRRAYAAGVDFPGIDPTLFGAPLRPEDAEALGLALLDINNVDLGAATGFVSTLARSFNFLGEQAAEVFGGEGTVFNETAEASGALNSLAQATRRFYLEGRTLAREFENLEREIPTFSGFLTDSDARRALGRQRELLAGELQRVRDVIENPRNYTNADISRARQVETYAQQLLNTYDQFLQAYQTDGGSQGSNLTYDEIMNNPDYAVRD